MNKILQKGRSSTIDHSERGQSENSSINELLRRNNQNN
jgi:hypothetical protein